MGNALRIFWGNCCKPTADSDSLGHHGATEATVPPPLPIVASPPPPPPPPPPPHPQGLRFELQTLPVDPRAVVDGDGMTVYVSTRDPRESSCVPIDVQIAAVQRSEARAAKNYEEADALRDQIKRAGYGVLMIQNEEILARKYRIRLRGIDAPEGEMPYGEEAKEELTKIVQGKCLRVLVFDEDQYERCVGDVYCNGIFVQELMLKKGLAWHYKAYDQRPELAKWEKDARAERIGLWASSNPEKPWEWRRRQKRGKETFPHSASCHPAFATLKIVYI